MITDDGRAIAESGAIVDYIVRRHGGGRLAPDRTTPAYETYQEWLHYAEGSAMLPLMLQLYTLRLGEAGAPLQPRIDSEIDNHLGYVDRALEGRDYLMGDQLTAADVQMSFVGEMGRAFGRLADKPEPRRLGRSPPRPSGLQARAGARRPVRDRAIGRSATRSSVRSSPNGRRLYCAAGTAIPKVGQSLPPTHYGVHSFQQVKSATACRTHWLTSK